MRRKYDWLSPLEAILLVCGSSANRIDRPRCYILCLFRAMVIAGDFAAVRTGINNFRIARIRRNVATLTSAYVVPAFRSIPPGAALAIATVELSCCEPYR